MKFFAIGPLSSFAKWLIAAGLVGAILVYTLDMIDVTAIKIALAGWCIALGQLCLMLGIIAFGLRLKRFGGCLIVIGISGYLLNGMLMG